MELWLLNSFGPLTLTVLMAGSVIVFAALGSLVVRRRLPQLLNGAQNDMVGVLLGMYGAIYGIFLAFVVVAEWEGIGVAETVVASEATHCAEIVRDADAFPEPVRREVSEAVGTYVQAVVNDQWPRMRAGRPSSEATEPAIRAVYRALQSYEPTTESQKTYYAQAVAHLDGVVAERRARLTLAQSSLPTLLKLLVYGGALVMIPMSLLYGIRSFKAHLTFVTLIALLIGLSLLLTMSLDRPFSGELSVSPAPYKEGALARFWE
ncbi:DUF4239 domain-containing protein [Streptomyces brasiliscabiei]|uniref:bestrophin-like domain n=1 Tax=Streptomyces brasiliscabiei TaxID=2736302 RepID=UPI001C10521B|nr:DUF4239 domain-containing protein [Streptomyces brasiliscabiei]